MIGIWTCAAVRGIGPDHGHDLLRAREGGRVGGALAKLEAAALRGGGVAGLVADRVVAGPESAPLEREADCALLRSWVAADGTLQREVRGDQDVRGRTARGDLAAARCGQGSLGRPARHAYPGRAGAGGQGLWGSDRRSRAHGVRARIDPGDRAVDVVARPGRPLAEGDEARALPDVDRPRDRFVPGSIRQRRPSFCAAAHTEPAPTATPSRPLARDRDRLRRHGSCAGRSVGPPADRRHRGTRLPRRRRRSSTRRTGLRSWRRAVRSRDRCATRSRRGWPPRRHRRPPQSGARPPPDTRPRRLGAARFA